MPSGSAWAFQSRKRLSISPTSSPRCCSVTGCGPSMSTRNWYQDRSQATVTTTSRGLRMTTLTRGSPSVRAMPHTVRGW